MKTLFLTFMIAITTIGYSQGIATYDNTNFIMAEKNFFETVEQTGKMVEQIDEIQQTNSLLDKSIKSLEEVSQAVKKSKKVVSIKKLMDEIQQTYFNNKKLLNSFEQNILSQKEKVYLVTVNLKLLEKAVERFSFLNDFTNVGLKMSDAERLENISLIEQKMEISKKALSVYNKKIQNIINKRISVKKNSELNNLSNLN